MKKSEKTAVSQELSSKLGKLLESTLEEEKNADTLLSEVAVANVNNEAAWEPVE
jgi:ferritin-like metal-binding protein YciE